MSSIEDACTMAQRNLEYEKGYSDGYDYAAYGGAYTNPIKELRLRGIKVNSSYGVAFRNGYKDRKDYKPKKYDY